MIDALRADPLLGVERVIHTPCSTILLCQGAAYKIRKPVNLGYLDFTTLESRRHFGMQEIRLNQALAPDVYERLLPIIQESVSSARILDQELGKPLPTHSTLIDYAVRMFRLPDEDMLPRWLDAGQVNPRIIQRLAEVLFRFHSRAQPGPALPGDFPRGETLTNLDQLKPFAGDGGMCSSAFFELLLRRVTSRLDNLAPLFRARLNTGRIRELHGDLHAGNICINSGHTGASPILHASPLVVPNSNGLPDIIIFDRIEFEPLFRTCDPAAEIATLSMDLIRRGHARIARDFISAYLAQSHDTDLPALLPIYRAHYAAVRAKVHAMRAAQADTSDAERTTCTTDAAAYAALALGSLCKPALILSCGLPGSGKSFIAEKLRRCIDSDWHRSDEIRKELAPHAAPADLYSRDSSTNTYAELLRRCESSLNNDITALADANFRDPATRAPFLALAKRLGVPILILHAHADEATTRQRLAARSAAGTDPSDADWAVYLKLRDSFFPPTAAEAPVILATPATPINSLLQTIITALA